MRRLHFFLLLLLSSLLLSPAIAALPQPAHVAPSFRLQDQNGHWHTPADFKGHWLVLYFYPKDFTTGCTTEVCSFRDDIAKLRQAGAVVVGISFDDVTSHAEFASKFHVPFPLLSDANRKVATTYGVLASDGGTHYARRTTFLIVPQGNIAKVYQDVDPEKNSAQVLHDLASLRVAS